MGWRVEERDAPYVPDPLTDELAHADGEVVSGATTSDLDPAPRAMGVEEDEEIDDAVAAILVIEAFGPSRGRRDWLTRFADELGGASSKPTTGRFGSGGSA